MKSLFYLLSIILLAVQSNAADWDATYACPAGNIIGFVVTGATNEPVRWSWVGKIRVVANATAVQTTSYLLQENFEGANSGYDNTSWTASAGGATLDPDASTSGLSLEGTNCLHILATAQSPNTYHSITATSNTWVYLLFRPNTNAASTYFLYFRNGSTTLGYATIGSSGKLGVFPTGGTSQTTTDGMSAGTTYGIWLNFQTGTGSNARMSGGFSSNGTRPTAGTSYVESTNGTSTANTDTIRLGAGSNISGEYWIDKLRVNNEVIGDNPQ